MLGRRATNGIRGSLIDPLMALYLRDAFEIITAYDLNEDMRGGENYIYIFFLGRAKEK